MAKQEIIKWDMYHGQLSKLIESIIESDSRIVSVVPTTYNPNITGSCTFISGAIIITEKQS